jgi:hypothetical protein
MFDVILEPRYSEKLVGWFGFGQIFFVAFGTCVMGKSCSIYFHISITTSAF